MRRLTRSSCSPSLAICLAGLMAASAGAHADIMIVSSSAPELKPGMQLDDQARLEVPAGAKVRVLLPSGATLQITGAASRPVKDITKGEPLVEAVWSKAKELLVTGGVDQSRVGATRGFKPLAPAPAPGEASGFAWNLITAAANGNVCVERGARLTVERPTGGKATGLTVIDAKNARGQIDFAPGAARADWPAALPVTSDASYQLMAADTPMRIIKLRLIDKAGTSDAMALRSLLENDCRTQAKAWAKG